MCSYYPHKFKIHTTHNTIRKYIVNSKALYIETNKSGLELTDKVISLYECSSSSLNHHPL